MTFTEDFDSKINIIDSYEIEYKMLGDKYLAHKRDLILAALLKTEYITSHQCLFLGFPSLLSANSALRSLCDNDYITGKKFSSERNDKVYTLKRNGYLELKHKLPGEVIDKTLDTPFREIQNLSGNIEHRVCTNDIYFALLTAPNLEYGDFSYHVSDSHVTLYNAENKPILRNDARLYIKGKEYWVEQDMATENSSQLKAKASKLASVINNTYLNVNKSMPSIFFTVDMKYKYSNRELTGYYTKETREAVKEAKLVYNAYKDFRDSKFTSLNEYLKDIDERIKANETNYRKVSELKAYKEYANHVAKLANGDLTRENYLEYKKVVYKKADKLKEKSIKNRLNTFYKNRFENVVIPTFTNNENENSLYDLMLKGLDIYLEKNENLSDFLHNHLLEKENIIKKILKSLVVNEMEMSTDEVVNINHDENKQISLDSNNLSFTVKDFYSIKDEEGYFDIAVEDLVSNLGAKVRTEKILESINKNLAMTFIFIVENKEKAEELKEKYNLEKYMDEDSNVIIFFCDRESLKTDNPLYH